MGVLQLCLVCKDWNHYNPRIRSFYHYYYYDYDCYYYYYYDDYYNYIHTYSKGTGTIEEEKKTMDEWYSKQVRKC